MSLPEGTAAFHLTSLQAKNLHIREEYDVTLSGNALLPEIEINTHRYVQNLESSNAGISTEVGSGTAQAITTTNNSNSNVLTPRNGAPLSHLLGEDTSTDEEEIISVSVTHYSNSPVVPVPTPPKQEPFPEAKSKDLFIKDPDSQPPSWLFQITWVSR